MLKSVDGWCWVELRTRSIPIYCYRKHGLHFGEWIYFVVTNKRKLLRRAKKSTALLVRLGRPNELSEVRMAESLCNREEAAGFLHSLLSRTTRQVRKQMHRGLMNKERGTCPRRQNESVPG